MESIEEIYNHFLDSSSKGPIRVGWGGKESQIKRFEVLTSMWDLNNSSILDLGCGLGAFYGYCKERYYNFIYLGLDINPRMIQEAKKTYGDQLFCQIDIFSKEISELKTFDFIFLSGALNLSEDNLDSKVYQIIGRAFDIASKGIAINFLSVKSSEYNPGEAYHNPLKMLELAFEFSRKVTLRHDYMDHDFTLFIFK